MEWLPAFCGGGAFKPLGGSDREAGHHVGSGAATKCSGDLSSTTATECGGFSGLTCRRLWAREGRSQEPGVILDKTRRTKRPR